MFPLRPHISKSTTKVIIVIIWIISLLLAIPMALAYTIVNHETMDDIPQCLPVNIPWVFFLWYKNFLCLVQYFIPCILISGAYIRSAGVWKMRFMIFLFYCESKMLTPSSRTLQ